MASLACGFHTYNHFKEETEMKGQVKVIRRTPRIKNKIGNRDSERSADRMTLAELEKALPTCRPRDRNKIERAIKIKQRNAT